MYNAQNTYTLKSLHQLALLEEKSEPYSLVQVFIEKMSPNRTLRVLTAEHMADSMRTHGLGVLNTSVNVTYQVALALEF